MVTVLGSVTLAPAHLQTPPRLNTDWFRVRVCDSELAVINHLKGTPIRKNVITQIGNVLNLGEWRAAASTIIAKVFKIIIIIFSNWA